MAHACAACALAWRLTRSLEPAQPFWIAMYPLGLSSQLLSSCNACSSRERQQQVGCQGGFQPDTSPLEAGPCLLSGFKPGRCLNNSAKAYRGGITGGKPVIQLSAVLPG